MQHLENVIAETSRKCDRETVKGKSEKLVDTSVLVQSPLLIDILEPAQNLSLIKHQNDSSIIDVVDAVEKTKTKHLRLLKKFDIDCKKKLEKFGKLYSLLFQHFKK